VEKIEIVHTCEIINSIMADESWLYLLNEMNFNCFYSAYINNKVALHLTHMLQFIQIASGAACVIEI